MVNAQAQALHLIDANRALGLVEYVGLAQSAGARVENQMGTESVDPSSTEVVGVVIGGLFLGCADHMVQVVDQHLSEAEINVVFFTDPDGNSCGTMFLMLATDSKTYA